MTPEKLDRTIEFILDHQAQAAVQIEQVLSALRLEQEQSALLKPVIMQLADIAQLQSNRLDRHDEMLARLDRILDRLTGPR